MRLNEVLETKSNDFNYMIREELSKYNASQDELINEGLSNAIDHVKKWFVKNEVEEIQYRVLSDEQGNHAFVCAADNQYEAAQFNDQSIEDTHKFSGLSEVEGFIEYLKNSGFVEYFDRSKIRKIVFSLVALIGAGAAAYFPLMILGPTVTTVAGYLANFIPPIASAVSTAIVWISSLTASVISAIMGSVVGDVLYKLVVVSATTVGGWMTMNLALEKLDDEQRRG